MLTAFKKIEIDFPKKSYRIPTHNGSFQFHVHGSWCDLGGGGSRDAYFTESRRIVQHRSRRGDRRTQGRYGQVLRSLRGHDIGFTSEGARRVRTAQGRWRDGRASKADRVWA